MLLIAYICAERNLPGLVDNSSIDDWQGSACGAIVVLCIGSMLRQRVIVHDDGQVQRYYPNAVTAIS